MEPNLRYVFKLGGILIAIRSGLVEPNLRYVSSLVLGLICDTFKLGILIAMIRSSLVEPNCDTFKLGWDTFQACTGK